MRLTAYTDFSLRVLIYLALHPEPRPTIAEIAQAYAISRNHLMKVVFDLGRDGLVATARGKKGGLRLGRPPGDIRLGEVVRRTEPDLALVPCFSPARQLCVITPACRLRAAMDEARAAFLDVLDGYTLADLVADPDPLIALLGRARQAEFAAGG
ncbi:MAG: Rrf2 family transcriptional regulator [Phenylobacterium sp.]|nr:Rrf2 family transcriptional regulator [Phenylobacterium sp.]